MSNNSFHNTLFLPEELVGRFNNNALKQEDFIYGIFQQHKDLTKTDIVSIFRRLQSKVSESSVSRSLSNLDTQGKIYKTNIKRQGEYGVPNTVYRIVEKGEIIEKVVEHKLKLDSNECLALELVLDFFKDNADMKDYVPAFWEKFNSIEKKLKKINY